MAAPVAAGARRRARHRPWAAAQPSGSARALRRSCAAPPAALADGMARVGQGAVAEGNGSGGKATDRRTFIAPMSSGECLSHAAVRLRTALPDDGAHDAPTLRPPPTLAAPLP